MGGVADLVELISFFLSADDFAVEVEDFAVTVDWISLKDIGFVVTDDDLTFAGVGCVVSAAKFAVTFEIFVVLTEELLDFNDFDDAVVVFVELLTVLGDELTAMNDRFEDAGDTTLELFALAPVEFAILLPCLIGGFAVLVGG